MYAIVEWFSRIKSRVKKALNDWHHHLCDISIMSCALEYGMSVEEFNSQTYANYVNHYGENQKLKEALDRIIENRGL